MMSAGSSRITWERCPQCGGPAAVGWRAVGTCPSLPLVEYAVEFDCRAGCNLTVEEMVGSFQSSITRRRPEVPHPVVPTGSPDAGRAAAPGSCPSPAIPAGGPSAGAPRTRRIHAMELIPGHAETVAEVWLW